MTSSVGEKVVKKEMESEGALSSMTDCCSDDNTFGSLVLYDRWLECGDDCLERAGKKC